MSMNPNEPENMFDGNPSENMKPAGDIRDAFAKAKEVPDEAYDDLEEVVIEDEPRSADSDLENILSDFGSDDDDFDLDGYGNDDAGAGRSSAVDDDVDFAAMVSNAAEKERQAAAERVAMAEGKPVEAPRSTYATDPSRTTREAALSAVANDAIAKKQRTLRYRLKKNKASYIMMGPYFLLFFLFTVLPVLMSIALSFTYFNMLEFPKFNGWSNYTKLFLNDDIFLISLKNTLIFAVVTGPISYLLCLLFAWIINEFSPKVRTFLTLIFYAPSICGNAYMVWSLILSSDRYGYLNGILMDLGLINEQKLWMQDADLILPCLIVVQLWLSLGTGFLSFIAGLQTVDKSLYEAAAIDGVKNRWQELWYVTLPAMKPQLMFGAVMQITQSFAVADISIQLAGNPSVNYAGATVVTHLLDYGSTRFDMGYASAIATVLFLLMVGTNKLVQKLLRRVGE